MTFMDEVREKSKLYLSSESRRDKLIDCFKYFILKATNVGRNECFVPEHEIEREVGFKPHAGDLQNSFHWLNDEGIIFEYKFHFNPNAFSGMQGFYLQLSWK